MAKEKIMGVEIGSYSLKLAVCTDGFLDDYVCAPLPDNMVKEDHILSWEALGDFIKETVSAHKLSCKNVALALPDRVTYIVRMTIPRMTINQLKINLPYEFHEYITEDMDKYYYDYSVIGMTEGKESKTGEMDLMAVAAPKEQIDNYKAMFRRAGLKLTSAAPTVSAFKSIIEDYEYEREKNEKLDYAILDIGHNSVKLHFFTKGVYDVTRMMEPGCSSFVEAICEKTSVDSHIAQLDLVSNKDNIQFSDELGDKYSDMAVEIMRVINFYGFNHPDSNLKKIHYCGGGSLIKPLLAVIEEIADYKLESISELLVDSSEMLSDVAACPQTLGIVWEQEV